MAAPYPGLALVSHGWTGTIIATVGPRVATYTPEARSSAAEVMAGLVLLCGVVHGGAWSVSVGSTGLLALSGPTIFVLSGTGTTPARLGYTGTYTGASTYSAAATYAGSYHPAFGVRIDGDALSTSAPQILADGSGGASPVVTPAGVTLTISDTHAGTWQAEIDVVGTYDVWLSGRIVTRCRIDSWTRKRLTRDPSIVTLTTSAQGVA